jgi:alpha-mannosidase
MHSGYSFKKQERALEFRLLRFQPLPKDIFRKAALSISGMGLHRWQCALVPHQGTWRESLSYRHAMEQQVPLLSYSFVSGLGRGGACDKTRTADRPIVDWRSAPFTVKPAKAMSLVEVTPASVVLSSMRLVSPKESAKTPQYELRLYETTGSPADVVIRLACPAGKVEETNLLGEAVSPAGKIDVAGREIRFHILPWKIVTLRIGGEP